MSGSRVRRSGSCGARSCHGTIIRYTLGALAGQQLPAIENGSTATFDRMGEGWRVHTVNDVVLSPTS